MKTPMRLASILAFLGAALACASPASAQTTYNWTDIDCAKSRIAAGPGLKCKVTNVVTTEGNVGAFRRWTAFGTTREGYVHIFLWEPENSYSYLTTGETTAEFLKWMYVNGSSTNQFTAVARYGGADYSMFVDTKEGRSCAGFRRTGDDRRGGYDWIMGGILCAPPGQQLAEGQFADFINRPWRR